MDGHGVGSGGLVLRYGAGIFSAAKRISLPSSQLDALDLSFFSGAEETLR